MESATLNLKGTHNDPPPPKKGSTGPTKKPNKQTEIISIQKDILALIDDIQRALATHQVHKFPKVQSLPPILQEAHTLQPL